jgi:hypothetical protein
MVFKVNGAPISRPFAGSLLRIITSGAKRTLAQAVEHRGFKLSGSPMKLWKCYPACNFDPLSGGIGVQN